MKNSLPSLNTIRFFECAARHLSFTRAGEELFVTQGAVSKQIKALEEQLGLQLFSRRGPYLELTLHGKKLLDSVSSALEIVNQGIASLKRLNSNRLTVSVLPSYANYWLLPRLGDLEKQYPDIELRLASSYANVNFAVQTDIDAGIRLGKGHWPGLRAIQLSTDRMFPVCAPDLASKIHSFEDLNKQTLLVDPLPRDEWELWFAAADHPYSAKKVKLYEDTGHHIRAAVQGDGVSLLREELIQEQLDAGVLVRLFDIEYLSDIHYYFVCPESRYAEPALARSRQWLESVAQRL